MQGQKDMWDIKRRTICGEGTKWGARGAGSGRLEKQESQEHTTLLKISQHTCWFILKVVNTPGSPMHLDTGKTAVHCANPGVHSHHTEVRVNIWGVTNHYEEKVLVSKFKWAQGSRLFAILSWFVLGVNTEAPLVSSTPHGILKVYCFCCNMQFSSTPCTVSLPRSNQLPVSTAILCKHACFLKK